MNENDRKSDIKTLANARADLGLIARQLLEDNDLPIAREMILLAHDIINEAWHIMCESLPKKYARNNDMTRREQLTEKQNRLIDKMKSQAQLTKLIQLFGWSAYLHANVKHPFFCDIICSDEYDWAKLAETYKEQIQFEAKGKTGNVRVSAILDAEMAEVYADVKKGDYYHARMELLDAFAVLMRMDDMLREMEGPGALPLLTEEVQAK